MVISLSTCPIIQLITYPPPTKHAVNCIICGVSLPAWVSLIIDTDNLQWYMDWTLLRMLHLLEYFGTYLGYLPTSPTSPHCGTFPTNPRSIPVGSQKFQNTKYCGISMFHLRNSLELVMHQACSCLTRIKITFSLG